MPYEALGESVHDGRLPLRVRHLSTDIQLALAVEGSFYMGSADDEGGRFDNETWKEETVQAFYIGIYPVTQAQYRDVMKKNPAVYRLLEPALNRPIENVRADEAILFASRAGDGLRLPTEIEWEYACRAGSREPRHGPIDEVAWHKDHPDWRRDHRSATVQEVGKLKGNDWGLHDMLGNVWEWTATRDDESKEYVVRGGSFMSLPRSCRAPARFSFLGDHAWRDIGFRIAVGIDDVLRNLKSAGKNSA
jgi:sulfatase modifying factor 1